MKSLASVIMIVILYGAWGLWNTGYRPHIDWGMVLVVLLFLGYGLVYLILFLIAVSALYWLFRLVRALCLYLESKAKR